MVLTLTTVFVLACDFSTSLGGSATKPTIIIQSPASGSQFREGEEIAIQSAATDASGIANVDLIVDGVTVRTDKPQPMQGTNLFTLTQKWQATAGTHTIGVRAYNTPGAASDIVTIAISVASSITQLPSSTPLPTVTLPIATLPTSSSIAFKFDDGVAQDQREAFQKGFALAYQYFGDVGPLSAFAYANLDALMDEANRYYKRSADSAASQDVKRRLLNGEIVAYAETDAMWFWVKDFWKSSSLSYRWAIMAHEYFHIVQKYWSKKNFDGQSPHWLSEGSAEYLGFGVAANAGLVDRNQLRKEKIERTRGILNPLSTMETRQGAEAEDTETKYSVGYLAAEFLATNYGESALLKTYWQARATANTWQDAFQTAFGISPSEYYQKFEEYRRTQFPPYCGAVGETNAPFSVKSDRQFPPGALSFQYLAYTQWSPGTTGYTFCVKGYPLATMSWSQASQILKYPKEYAKLDSCGGSCWILYMNPSAPAGTYTFAAELPDGRRAEAQFQHGASSTSVVAQPTQAPPTRIPTISSIALPTPVPPTRVPSTPTPPLPPGIYVSAVQLDPPEPKDRQYPTFNVTFINTLGQTVYYKWYVKIFDPDAKQSMGETAKVDSTLPPGTSVQSSAANWKAIGTSPCRQFIARVFYQAPDKTILEFPKPGGDNLWHYFSVCQ
jgi:hypothetical protein